MATVTLGERQHVPVAAPASKAPPPVAWWAALGAAVLAFEAYLIISWVAAGLEATPRGPDPIPTWAQVSVAIQETGSVLALLVFSYFVLIRPWRRQGRISQDGIFVFVFLLMYWQDPILNYIQPMATYSTGFVQFGSWLGQMPGVSHPNAGLIVEPIIWAGSAYVWALFGAVMFSNWLMRKVKTRRPSLGTVQTIALFYAFFIVFDLCAELIWVRTGVFMYPGVIQDVSLFAGEWYQFPLYEPFLFGGVWASWACLRYFKNDKGETVAERGIDNIETSGRRKTVLRVLALSGICNLTFLLFAIFPYWLISIHIDSWPKSYDTRSYFRDGVCGAGTDYACPGPNVPIVHGKSMHLDPSGNLVGPRIIRGYVKDQ